MRAGGAGREMAPFELRRRLIKDYGNDVPSLLQVPDQRTRAPAMQGVRGTGELDQPRLNAPPKPRVAHAQRQRQS
jgi:hypothetical protein